MTNAEVEFYRSIMATRKTQQRRRKTVKSVFNFIKFAILSFMLYICVYSGGMFLINAFMLMRATNLQNGF